MVLNKDYISNLSEVSDEIDSALKDARGITVHQKRLAFCISLGVIEVLESYLKKKNALKKGFKLNHQWFKKKRENVKKILENKVISSLDDLPLLDKILDVCYKVETKRNELAYGSQSHEEILRELINDFLDIKKEVENE